MRFSREGHLTVNGVASLNALRNMKAQSRLECSLRKSSEIQILAQQVNGLI